MALCRLPRKGLVKYKTSCTFFNKCSQRTNSTSSGNEEYTASPQYPPILDLSPISTYKRERDFKLDKLKRIGTVEEKFLGINIPRYYGWSSLMLKEGSYPFNFLPFVQHITRTDVIPVEKLPFASVLSQSEFENVLRTIKPQLQEAIIMEMVYKR